MSRISARILHYIPTCTIIPLDCPASSPHTLHIPRAFLHPPTLPSLDLTSYLHANLGEGQLWGPTLNLSLAVVWVRAFGLMDQGWGRVAHVRLVRALSTPWVLRGT